MTNDDERKAFEAFWYEKMAGRGFSRIRCAKSGWFARAALAVPSEGIASVELRTTEPDKVLKIALTQAYALLDRVVGEGLDHERTMEIRRLLPSKFLHSISHKKAPK